VALTQSRLKTTVFLLFLTGILFLIYANALNTSFQSDDERHIFLNVEIDNPAYYLNLIPDTGLLEKITLRQISLLAFALNYQWSQENPFGYHLFNILIHIVTVILVFTIVSLTIKNSTEWGEKDASIIGAITALLFGLHPVQTETVTYISGIPGGMAALFFLLSLLMFILGGLKRFSSKNIPSFIFYALSLFMFFVAVLCKETAITLPVILLLYDLYFMKGENWKVFRSRIGFYTLFPIIAMLIYLQSPHAFLWAAIRGLLEKANFSLILVQLDILKIPIKLFFFPINLSFEHTIRNQVMWGSLLISIFGLVVTLFLVIKKFYLKSAILSFSILWFLITLAPTNSIMPRTHLISERNLYLPYFGFCLFFAVIIYLIFFKETRNKLLWGVSLVLLIGISFSSLVVKRNQAYATPSSLWADTLQKNPHNLTVGKTLSVQYLKEEKYPEALKTITNLLRTHNGHFDLHQNMGIAFKHLGDMTNAERKFKDAISIKPKAAEPHYALASLYGSLGKPIEASKEFDISAKLFIEGMNNPTFYYQGHVKLPRPFVNGPPHEFYLDKARAHNQAGIAYINLKKYEEALQQFEKSVKQNPKSLEARFNLAKLLLEFKNDKVQTAIHLKEALKLNPTPSQAQVLQKLLFQAGQ